MNALSFQNLNDQVTIAHDGADRVFSTERLRRIVSTYLTYYREGATDLAVTLDYAFDADRYGSECPAEFDADCREYWSHRRELYDFVQSQNLFPITLAAHTAAEADVDAVARKCREQLGRDACLALFQTWKSLDAQLASCDFADADQRTALLRSLITACRNSPVCALIPKILLEDYGISNRQEACKACFNHATCRTESGSHYLTHRLTAKLYTGNFSTDDLNALRQQILAAIPARDAVLRQILTPDE